MLLTFVVNLVLFGPTFETPTNTEEVLAGGIVFQKEGKIRITERFTNVEFLVHEDSTSRTLYKVDFAIRVL